LALAIAIILGCGGWLVHDDLAERDALAHAVPVSFLLRAPTPRTVTAESLLVAVPVATPVETAACGRSDGHLKTVYETWLHTDLCVISVPTTVEYGADGDLWIHEDETLGFGPHNRPRLEQLVAK
jgi:hypothetical protein